MECCAVGRKAPYGSPARCNTTLNKTHPPGVSFVLSLIEQTVNDRSLVHTYVRAAHYVLPESSVLGLFSAAAL